MGNRLGKEQEGGSLLDPEELLQECREHLIQLFTLWCQQTFQTRLRQIQLEQEMERLDSIRAELEGLRVYLAVFQDPTLEDQEDWDMETKVQEWMEQAEDDLHNLRVNLLEPQQEDRPPNPQGSLRDSRESSPEDNRDPSLRDSLLERLLDSQEDLREDSLPFSQQDQEEVPDSLPTQWEESLLDSQVEYSPTNHQGAPREPWRRRTSTSTWWRTARSARRGTTWRRTTRPTRWWSPWWRTPRTSRRWSTRRGTTRRRRSTRRRSRRTRPQPAKHPRLRKGISEVDG